MHRQVGNLIFDEINEQVVKNEDLRTCCDGTLAHTEYETTSKEPAKVRASSMCTKCDRPNENIETKQKRISNRESYERKINGYIPHPLAYWKTLQSEVLWVHEG